MSRRKNLNIFLNQLTPLELDKLIISIFDKRKVITYKFDERVENIIAKVNFGVSQDNIKTFYITNFGINTTDSITKNELNAYEVKLRLFLLKKFGHQYNFYDFQNKKNLEFNQKLIDEEKRKETAFANIDLTN